MEIDDLIENPAFWILGGGGVAMELLGWIWSKRMGWVAMPFWQLLVMMLGTLVAAAIFANKE